MTSRRLLASFTARGGPCRRQAGRSRAAAPQGGAGGGERLVIHGQLDGDAGAALGLQVPEADAGDGSFRI
jgi:hypothetical protein